jgi:MerR family redox-sensitive transcriptional activator SoxR
MRTLREHAGRPPLPSAEADKQGIAPLNGIGEVARRTGLAPSALRYYEELGLLPGVARHHGRRLYSTAVIDRLAFVRAARRAGFTLGEIRRLLPVLELNGKAGSAARRAVAGRKLAELDEAISTLGSMRGLLIKALECNCREVERCELLRDLGGKPDATARAEPTGPVRKALMRGRKR